MKYLVITLLALTLLSCGSDSSESSDSSSNIGSSSVGSYTVERDETLMIPWYTNDSLAIINGDNNIDGQTLIVDSITVIDEAVGNDNFSINTISFSETQIKYLENIQELNTYYIVNDAFEIVDSIVNYAEAGHSQNGLGESEFTILAYDFSIDVYYEIIRVYEPTDGTYLSGTPKSRFEDSKAFHERVNASE